MRPPLALDRLTETSGGQLLYQFRRPWSDGATALRLEPREWLERLAALVPAPRRPLRAHHGVLAPHARWRPQVVGYGRVAPEAAAGDPAEPRRVPAPPPRHWTWAAVMRRAFVTGRPR